MKGQPPDPRPMMLTFLIAGAVLFAGIGALVIWCLSRLVLWMMGE